MGIKTRIGNSLSEAKFLLQKGDLVAIPTETVYGLAANGLNPGACTSIFEVKNRPFFDPLILHIGSINQLNPLVRKIPEEYKILMEKFWPGPITFIFDKSDIIPDVVCSGGSSVAIRMPSHPLTNQLLTELEFPLAAPSANPFKYVSPTTPFHVLDQLGGKIPYILDGGDSVVGLESTIVKLENGILKVLRVGGITTEALNEVTENIKLSIEPQDNPIAPGQLEHHYSPNCTLQVIEDLNQINNSFDALLRVIPTQLFIPEDLDIQIITLSNEGDIKLAAQNLFKELRNLDNRGFKKVALMLGPEEGLGRAINDRLIRAANKSY